MNLIIILVTVLLTGILVLLCYWLIKGLKEKKLRSIFKYDYSFVSPDKKISWNILILIYIVSIVLIAYVLITAFIIPLLRGV